MHDIDVIGNDSLPAGIVQRVRSGFRFYAAPYVSPDKDAQHFATPWQAQWAAEEIFDARLHHRKLAMRWTGQLQSLACSKSDVTAMDAAELISDYAS